MLAELRSLRLLVIVAHQAVLHPLEEAASLVDVLAVFLGQDLAVFLGQDTAPEQLIQLPIDPAKGINCVITRHESKLLP